MKYNFALDKLLAFLATFSCLLYISTAYAVYEESFNPSELNSQPFFHQITAESPVINGSNYSSIEDSNGFIWFGGTAGLARFDGYEFINYLPDENNPNAIKGLHVNTMAADQEGGLWLGIYKVGLAYFSPKTQSFTYFLHQSGNENSPASNLIKKIIVLNNGDLWIGTSNGVNYFNKKESTFYHYINSSQEPKANFIISMTLDPLERLWVYTTTGVSIVDKNNEMFTAAVLYDEDGKQINQQELKVLYRKIKALRSGQLWLGGFYNSLFVINQDLMGRTDIQPHIKTDKLIHAGIEQVSPNQVWVKIIDRSIKEQSIKVFDSQHFEKVYQLSNNALLDGGIDTSKVINLHADTQEITWMTTVDIKPVFTDQKLKAYKFYREHDTSIYRKKNILQNISLMKVKPFCSPPTPLINSTPLLIKARLITSKLRTESSQNLKTCF